MRYLLILSSLALLLVLFACSEEGADPVSAPTSEAAEYYFGPRKASVVSPGTVHNQILTRLSARHTLLTDGAYDEVEGFVKDMKASVNDAFADLGIRRTVTSDDIWRGICCCDSLCDAGLMVRPDGKMDPLPTFTDPDAVLAGIVQRGLLTQYECTWLEGLYDVVMALPDPTPDNVEAAAFAYGMDTGLPMPGTPLGNGFDILLRSNRFWTQEKFPPSKSDAKTIGVIWVDALTGLVDGPIVGAIMSTIAIIAVQEDTGDS